MLAQSVIVYHTYIKEKNIYLLYFYNPKSHPNKVYEYAIVASYIYKITNE